PPLEAGCGHDSDVPGAARRAPRPADPRPCRGGQSDGLHSRIVRRSHARSALVRAVSRAPEDRRRVHGGARRAWTGARAAPGYSREIRRQARLTGGIAAALADPLHRRNAMPANVLVIDTPPPRVRRVTLNRPAHPN